MMSPISIKALASLAAFLTVSNAHMVMKSPVPFNSPNNSPLDPSGSDFPCKMSPGTSLSSSAPSNDFEAGQSYTLSFTGSAVHGGGSCQVSLADTLSPTKDTKWMVIKSIEGGCPASVAGNLPADPNGSGAATFQYTIPAGISPGQYTIAWTWHNKVGNREMYMNCGLANIGGAKKKRYAPTPKPAIFKREDYPGMFVANIANVGHDSCAVPEGIDVKYPAPGSDLTVGQGANLNPPTGSCGSTGGSTGGYSGSGAGSSSAAAQPTTTAAAAAPPATETATATGGFGGGRPSVSPGNFATVSQSSAAAAAPTASQSSAAPAVPTQTASAASPPPPVNTGTSGGSSAGAQSGPCTQEGAWSCSADGTSFQRCASGQWSAPMQMATGTQCTPGTSMNFAMKVIGSSKRDLKSHISHRRHAQVVS